MEDSNNTEVGGTDVGGAAAMEDSNNTEVGGADVGGAAAMDAEAKRIKHVFEFSGLELLFFCF